jgi:putative alpha-1,2-mannosidase
LSAKLIYHYLLHVSLLRDFVAKMRMKELKRRINQNITRNNIPQHRYLPLLQTATLLMKKLLLIAGCILSCWAYSQSPANLVNVFLGSSGDHGQMSPAASYPFGMLSIGPQTYPNLHMGYEHRAKTFLGFTHNRFEGVGCMGSGGNIMITPFTGNADSCTLIKATEKAGAGSYAVSFTNGIAASFVVVDKTGLEDYTFPSTAATKGFIIDLSHTLANRFVAEEHTVASNTISGWVDAKTTCSVGTYRVYYYLQFGGDVSIVPEGEHGLKVQLKSGSKIQVQIALSAVDVAHAKSSIESITENNFKNNSTAGWNNVLNAVTVKGSKADEALFYSLLYRTVQSPYLISEKDGSYRNTAGGLENAKDSVYNGWAIWDNYRTQLPLLALLYPSRYKNIISSIGVMYKHEKRDYATQHEPSNTVRTEHAIVVLLDAYRKGFPVDFKSIQDSLKREVDSLDFTHPDKALESSYDTWALSQILKEINAVTESKSYLQKAGEWKQYWQKDFADITRPDVDRVGARGMYQGTIWQYRWLVPFDNKGLVEAAGGEAAYLQQLDRFFNNDLYNHANETDIQAPFMYNFTSQPWKSQAMARKYAADTVVQYYFNDNSRGIDPFVDVIYQNKPDTYIRTMDDDAGAMSGWYVFTAMGLMPACVGWPIYYLNVPLFTEVKLNGGSKIFTISTINASKTNRYIQSATLNGKPLNRNWLTHQEIAAGGTLVITAGSQPNKQLGTINQWISSLEK